jgi:predicted Zn-dependent peptidase
MRARAGAILVAVLVGAAPPAPGPAASPQGTGAAGAFRIAPPARTVLKNGLTVLVAERRSIPLVHFRILVKAGAAADPAGKEGTAALCARLLKRGTRSRPARQFAEEVEFVGGAVEAEAHIEQILISGEFASRDAEIAFNLLSDMMLNAAFVDGELQKEKRQQIAALVGRRDDAERVADEAFDGWLFGTHPYGRPVDGTEASVAAIGRADVAAFYETRVVPNNAVLAIVGDIDAASAAQKAERYFGPWKRRAVADARPADPVPVKGRRVLLIDKPDATQAQIRLGNVGLRRSDPEYIPALVGNTVLGSGFTSLLVEEVRVKRGLTYGIGSALEARRAPGSVAISTFTRNEAVLETIGAVLDQVRRLREGAVPAEAFERARSYLAGRYPLQIESPEGLAAALLLIEFHGLEPDTLNQYPRKVRAAGSDAVRKAAQKFLPLDDLAIVVVGPASLLKEDLATLGPVTVRPLAPPPAAGPRAGT